MWIISLKDPRETHIAMKKSWLALGELVAKFKDELDAEVKKNEGKNKFDAKSKIHVAIKPSTGFIAKAVRHSGADPGLILGCRKILQKN